MEDIKYINEKYYKNVDWLFERTTFDGKAQKALVNQLLMRYVEKHEKPGDIVKLHMASAMQWLLRDRYSYINIDRYEYIDAEYRAFSCSEYLNSDNVNIKLFDRSDQYVRRFDEAMWIEKEFEHLKNVVLGMNSLHYKSDNICIRFFSKIWLDEHGKCIEFILNKSILYHLIAHENLPCNDNLWMRN